MFFVEASVFTQQARQLLDDETFRAFQNDLAREPEKGAVMQGCGGLRKARVEAPQRGKGKRGGFRVIYLHIPEAGRIDLLAIYGKDCQDDLTEPQKRALKQMAEQARREALAWKGRGT